MALRLIESWWSQLRVQQKVWLILLAVFVPLVAALVVHVSLINQLLAVQQQHQQTVLAREQVQILRRIAVKIEDGFHGYLLTREDRFLKPLEEAESNLEPTIARAVALVESLPGLATDVRGASQRLTALLDSKHALIQQLKAGREEEVLAYVRSGKGLALSDAVRDDFRRIEDRLDIELRSFEVEQKGLAQHAFWGLLLAVVGCLSLGLLGARLLSRSITKPLAIVQAAAVKLGERAEPDWKTESIPVHAADEIGRLARSFEEMARRISHYIEHLEALHATGQEITMLGSGGLEMALRRIADRAADLAKVDLAVLMVRHPILECWVVEAASGAAFDTVRKEIILLEETPFCNQAFETKRPVMVADLSQHADKPVRFRDRYRAKSSLVVPLLGPHEAIGALELLSTRSTTVFSDQEVRLAQQFAAYAAIAIENARLFEAVESETHELKQKLRAVERDMANLTHEVKAPAGRVSEFATWIANDYRDRLDERALRYLEWIRKEGQDLFQLAERTLDLVRVIQEPHQVESFDTGAVVREVLDVAAGQHSLDGIQVMVADELPRVACRRVHLKQVFENLIGNAIKYMGDQKEPKIEIGAERTEQGVLLYVRDNGIGMDPAVTERIFQPFQRLGNLKVPGAGLGLCIVKTVVEQYGGVITVYSQPGIGSTFYVRLPVVSSSPSESALHRYSEASQAHRGEMLAEKFTKSD